MEIWDLYNEEREKTGETLVRGQSIPQGRYHIVIGAWVMNSLGQILLSQRQSNIPNPNYWECTGGSVLAGESSLEGAVREAREELGIVLNPENAILFYQRRRDEAQDFCDAWVFRADATIDSLKLQKEEVAAAKWVSKEELYEAYLKKELNPGIDYIEEVIGFESK